MSSKNKIEWGITPIYISNFWLDQSSSSCQNTIKQGAKSHIFGPDRKYKKNNVIFTRLARVLINKYLSIRNARNLKISL